MEEDLSKPEDTETVQDSLKMTTIKEIGDGLHAKIYLAREIGNHDELKCLKVFKKGTESVQEEEEMRKQAEEEFTVSQLLDGHPNIVRINSFHKDTLLDINGKQERRDFLMLDYCENSDLFDFMSRYA